MYTLLRCLTAGYGYINYVEAIKTLSKFTNTSERTVRRWIDKLGKSSVLKIKDGVIYPIGKKRFYAKFNTLTKTQVIFEEEHLRSYKGFKRHIIQQIALLTQRRFRYGYKLMSVDDATSLVKSGKIENTLLALKSRKQAGCSISQLQKRLHLDKKTISVALKGCTEKQVNYSNWINGNVVRLKYGTLLDVLRGRNIFIPHDYKNIHKFCFEYDKTTDRYRLGASLASLIKVDSYLQKSKKNQIYSR